MVIGAGRRGEGEIIIGKPDQQPDFSAPLAPVYSYGVLQTERDAITLTLREIFDDQISVEIVGMATDAVAEIPGTVRKWTYARWKTGLPCPQCGDVAREVHLARGSEPAAGHVLAFCPRDRRIWIYDGIEKTCRPIPVTQYHNELMIHKNIRQPEVALKSDRMFSEIGKYSDDDLAAAFAAYNRLKSKVDIHGIRPPESPPANGIVRRLIQSLFAR